MGSEAARYIPLGCSKTPFSTPTFRALLKSESNMLSETTILLLARTYFLRDWRLANALAALLVECGKQSGGAWARPGAAMR